MKPLIGEVQVNGPAYTAGIRQGDLILAVNDVETATWERARFALLEESVGAQQIVVRVQSPDLQIREHVINLAKEKPQAIAMLVKRWLSEEG